MAGEGAKTSVTYADATASAMGLCQVLWQTAGILGNLLLGNTTTAKTNEQFLRRHAMLQTFFGLALQDRRVTIPQEALFAG